MDGGAEIVFQGIGAAPGQAAGSARVYRRPAPIATTTIPAEAVPAEQGRVAEALAAAQGELDRLAAEVRLTIGAAEAEIFTAQALMAGDPMLQERAAELVAAEHLAAPAALLAAAGEQAQQLATLDDPYLRERAADLHDVGERAARLAMGHGSGPGLPPLDLRRLDHPTILLADDLTPSETAQLDPAHILGLALARGGPTSHAAVIARALGVPLVCGLGELPDPAGRPALVDGDAGLVVLDPTPARLAAYESWHAARRQTEAAEAGLQDLPAATADGHRVRLVANAGSVAEARAAAARGAEGIGLLRTEFLFLDHAPDEAEQLATYRAVYAAFPEGEVIVRTMDLGGDKPPPYLDFGDEANPFLGWRGLRVALDRPDLLRPQLRALLQAGAGREVHVMFPMVTTLDELRRARAAVDAIRGELAATGSPHAETVHVGIMVEVPACALLAAEFAAEADFFSIGTNDLTQYTLAADRGAARVAELYSPLQPAVLRLIARTVEGAHAAGRPVGMCGEAAGNPAWTALWLGLGLDELSMAPSALPGVKAALRRTTLTAARALAEQALRRATLEDVTTLLAAGPGGQVGTGDRN